MCDPDAAATCPWQLSALPILVRVRMWRKWEGSNLHLTASLLHQFSMRSAVQATSFYLSHTSVFQRPPAASFAIHRARPSTG